MPAKHICGEAHLHFSLSDKHICNFRFLKSTTVLFTFVEHNYVSREENSKKITKNLEKDKQNSKPRKIRENPKNQKTHAKRKG